MQSGKKQAHFQVKRLTMCGMGVAIAVVLDGFFKVPVNLFGTYALKLTFGMVPILFLSVSYGPLYGGLCGAIMDFLQAILFPIGAFNPLFTISAFVMGATPGLIQHGSPLRKGRLALGIAAGQILGSVVLSTIFLIITYGLPWQIIWARALTQAVLIPLYTMMVGVVCRLEARRAF